MICFKTNEIMPSFRICVVGIKSCWKKCASDDLAFSKCKSIADYEKYITQYDVYYYAMQHKKEAYEAISAIRKKEEEYLRVRELARKEEEFWETHRNRYLKRQQYLMRYPNGKYKSHARILDVARYILLAPLYVVPWLIGALPLVLTILVDIVCFSLIVFFPQVIFFPFAIIYNVDALFIIGHILGFPWWIGIYAFCKIRQGEFERGERENVSKVLSSLLDLHSVLKKWIGAVQCKLRDLIDLIL